MREGSRDLLTPSVRRPTCELMRDESDEVVCLRMPDYFLAVGLHYIDFGQTEDGNAERILRGFRFADART